MAIALLFSLNGIAQYSYTIQTSGTTENLLGVYFINENTGWACGEWGTLLKTTNGGNTWNTLPDPEGGKSWVHSVYFSPDGLTGWVSTTGGGIFKSTNGGASWIEQNASNNSSNDMNEIVFVDANTGWACGNSGEMRYTNDGGTTWTNQTTNTVYGLYEMAFVDENNGWAAGLLAGVWHTSDGGTTWEAQTTPHSWQDIYGIDFIDANTGYYAGFWGIIAQTTDGGATWEKMTKPTNNTLHNLDAINECTIWAVGDSGDIVHTIDGGVTWNQVETGDNNHLKHVMFVNDTTGWAVGESGTIIKITGLVGCQDDVEPCLVTIYDTITTEIFDTTHITVYDTNYVTVYNSITVTDTLIIDISISGIDPPGNIHKIKIYPNPTNSYINIDIGNNYLAINNYTIKIINTTGTVVFEETIDSQYYSADLSTLGDKGIYFIQIADEGNTIVDTRTIILQ